MIFYLMLCSLYLLLVSCAKRDEIIGNVNDQKNKITFAINDTLLLTLSLSGDHLIITKGRAAYFEVKVRDDEETQRWSTTMSNNFNLVYLHPIPLKLSVIVESSDTDEIFSIKLQPSDKKTYKFGRILKL
jgi:hypothetical protein